MAHMHYHPIVNDDEEAKQRRKLLPLGLSIATVLIAANELLALNLILPFCGRLALSLGVPEKFEGEAAAGLTGFYGLGLTISSAPWGRASDILGRRSTLLASAVCSALSVLILGFSQSFILSLIVRFLGGVCNGLLPILKSALNEQTTPENRTRCFALLQVASGAGAIMGPMLGGVLVGKGPHERPFLVPCVVTAGVQLWFAGLGVAIFPAASKVTTNSQPEQEERRRVYDDERDNEAASTGRRAFVVATALCAISSFADSLCGVAQALILSSPSSMGGAGLSTETTGLVFGGGGCIFLLFMMCVFPRIERNVHLLDLFSRSQLFVCAASVALPSIINMPRPQTAGPESRDPATTSVGTIEHSNANAVIATAGQLNAELIIVILGIMSCASAAALISGNVLIQEAIDFAGLPVGSANGIAQAWDSFGRLIAPFIAGAMFDAGNAAGLYGPVLPFTFLALCAILLNATARYFADLFRDAVDTDLEIQPQFNMCAEVGLDVSDALGIDLSEMPGYQSNANQTPLEFTLESTSLESATAASLSVHDAYENESHDGKTPGVSSAGTVRPTAAHPHANRPDVNDVES